MGLGLDSKSGSLFGSRTCSEDVLFMGNLDVWGNWGRGFIGRYRISESEPDLRCVSIVIGTTGVVPDRGS